MPFKSDKQRRYMYSQHPEIAKRWRKKYGPQKNLPESAKSSVLRAWSEGKKKMSSSKK